MKVKNKTKASAFPRRQANTPNFKKKNEKECEKLKEEKSAERKAAH